MNNCTFLVAGGDFFFLGANFWPTLQFFFSWKKFCARSYDWFKKLIGHFHSCGACLSMAEWRGSSAMAGDWFLVCREHRAVVFIHLQKTFGDHHHPWTCIKRVKWGSIWIRDTLDSTSSRHPDKDSFFISYHEVYTFKFLNIFKRFVCVFSFVSFYLYVHVILY